MVHEMEIVKQYASSIWFKYNQVCVQEPKYRMRQDAVGGFSLLSQTDEQRWIFAVELWQILDHTIFFSFAFIILKQTPKAIHLCDFFRSSGALKSSCSNA